MTRQHKYRGRRKLNGDWVYGSYVYIGNDWCQILPEGVEWEDREMFWNRVITDSVGQYIGLTDKIDNQIYEGDFLGDREGRIFRVFWDDARAGFRYEPVAKEGKKFDGRIGTRSTACKAYLMKMLIVIGNEFDNPEILKNGSK